MICANNDLRCETRGYCSCYNDSTAEAASGCGELLFFLVAGVVVSFLYPAIKIARSPWKFDANGFPQLSGAKWLFVSPFFGMLSNMLFQIVFAIGACSLGALETKITSSIYITSIFLIYFLAIGLAVLSFLIKNRKEINLYEDGTQFIKTKNVFVLAGAVVMAILAVLAGLGAVLAATTDVFIHQKENQLTRQKPEQLIALERAKFDQLTGKYKLISRKDSMLFLISKSADQKNLRLNSLNNDSAKIEGNSGCLLSPNIKDKAIYYAVSECIVDGKVSPLSEVYFEVEKNKTTMTFNYKVRSNTDTLEKIK